MDYLSSKELRLWCDVFADKHRKAVSSKPLTSYIQEQILLETGLCIAKSTIIKNVKPFKKHGKKSLIVGKGQTIKVIRKRKKQAH